MVFRRVLNFLINFTIIFIIVTFSPGLGPKTTFPFEEFSIEDVKPLDGPLKANSLLDNAKRLFEGKLDAPEHILERDGILYVVLRTNEIVKIVNDEIKVVTSFGKSCYNMDQFERSPCGRPLGMVFDTLGNNLIVAHSYLGIFEVNIETGEKKHLVKNDEIIGETNPRPCKLFNSVAVTKNGDIYFTHSSSEYGIDKVVNSALVNPSGRLIHYCREHKKVAKVLLDNLYFANGLVVSPQEDFIVVAETMRSKLIKCWIKGDKKGTFEDFFAGIPGSPDNLSSNKNGILVALASVIDGNKPSLPHVLSNRPYTRRFIARFFELTMMPFQFINSIYPNPVTNFITNEFGTTKMFMSVIPNRRMVIRFDWNGKIIKSYHGSDESLGMITHALEVDNYLYIGSVISNYIGRVNLKK